uniref:Ig-like domain-containing protein n=1 Tax=Magallana gigas TaxID=29159 RepID=A0A8W8M8W0_MAGGI
MLSILLTVRVALIRLVGSEYIVNGASKWTWVNPGETYVAYCNIPGQGALYIIQNLKIQWLHNNQQLTDLCEFLSSELAKKYSCKVLAPQPNNISFELTVSNVQKADAGNLTCDVYEKIKENNNWVRDELVAIKSLPIQVREPIKSMMFMFGANKDEYLTRDNNDAIHQMEVLSGKYAPSCEAMGGMPKANIQIMMGDQMMQGKIMDIENKMGTEFVADATDFRAEPKEYYPPTGVTSPGHWRDSTPTGDCGGNSPLGAHQSDCHNPRRKSSSDSGPNSYLPPLPIPAEPKEYYPPTGVTSPGHWRDSTPTGDCGGNSPLGAHQSDCHNPRRKSSSDSGPNSYLPPLV